MVLACEDEAAYPRFLIGLGPKGLVPTLLGLDIHDQEYNSHLQEWNESHLTRIPAKFPGFSGRAEYLQQLQQHFSSFQADDGAEHCRR